MSLSEANMKFCMKTQASFPMAMILFRETSMYFYEKLYFSEKMQTIPSQNTFCGNVFVSKYKFSQGNNLFYGNIFLSKYKFSCEKENRFSCEEKNRFSGKEDLFFSNNATFSLIIIMLIIGILMCFRL